MWSYVNPTRIVTNPAGLPDLINELVRPGHSEAIAVITGRHAAQELGWYSVMQGRLPKANLEFLSMVDREPTEANTTTVAKALESVDPNCVIALGGGSVIDVAKIATSMLGNEVACEALMSRAIPVPKRSVPLIAVPTTAGSGSEVTPFAVLAAESGLKRSLPSRELYPDAAFLDTEFLLSLPKNVIGDAGMDALAHALEALWSIKRNPVSDALALRSAVTLISDLKDFHKNPDRQLAESIQVASNQAGLAFSNTFTAACHAISYPISTRFNLSHGAACAVTLDRVASLNLRDSAVMQRLRVISRALGIEPDGLPVVIREIRDSVTPYATPSSLSAANDDIQYVVDNFFPPLMANNPVRVEAPDIENMFRTSA
jgi:alcohol dehydrogenase class IV